jgi:hypothetical protein
VLPLHGFGTKTTGLASYGRWLTGADSMAWSYVGRREPDARPHTAAKPTAAATRCAGTRRFLKRSSAGLATSSCHASLAAAGHRTRAQLQKSSHHDYANQKWRDGHDHARYKTEDGPFQFCGADL